MYAKAQNVRPTYIKAYDAVLANLDVLVMPTCIMTAPKNQTPGSYLEAVEENLATMNWSGSRNTLPFNYTGQSSPRPSRGQVVSWVSQSACSWSAATSTTRSS